MTERSGRKLRFRPVRDVLLDFERSMLEPRSGAWLAAFRVLFGVAMCVSMLRFIAYGWIDELFAKQEIPTEVWTQAAIGLYEAELAARPEASPNRPVQAIGFNNTPHPRAFHLTAPSTDPNAPPHPGRFSVQRHLELLQDAGFADPTATLQIGGFAVVTAHTT